MDSMSKEKLESAVSKAGKAVADLVKAFELHGGEITDLQVARWIVVDSPKQLRVTVEPVAPGRFAGRVEAWRDAPNPVLSRWETHAEAVIVAADHYAGEPETPAPLKDAVPFATPYDGSVFHGPAFATLMDGARI
ncbi:MAG: hypothetical protein B7W97_02160, partial [Mycobacterium sp. 20-66-4]